MLAGRCLLGGLVFGIVSRCGNQTNGVFIRLEIDRSIINCLVIGTVAFILFLSSMKYISAMRQVFYQAWRPLTAMIISVIWLQPSAR